MTCGRCEDRRLSRESVEIPWTGGSTEQQTIGGTVLLGLLKLHADGDCGSYSTERQELIRGLIEERLAIELLQNDLIDPMESAMAEMWDRRR